MSGANNTINTYEKAVNRIASKNRRPPLAETEPSKYEQLINMAKNDALAKKKRTMPLIESVETDSKVIKGRRSLAQYNKLTNISNLGVNSNFTSTRSASRGKPTSININQTLEIPEVFNRLYKQE